MLPKLLLDVVEFRCDEVFERKACYRIEHPVEHNLHDACHLPGFYSGLEVLEDECKDVLDLDVDYYLRDRASRVQNALINQGVHVLRDLVDERWI